MPTSLRHRSTPTQWACLAKLKLCPQPAISQVVLVWGLASLGKSVRMALHLGNAARPCRPGDRHGCGRRLQACCLVLFVWFSVFRRKGCPLAVEVLAIRPEVASRWTPKDKLSRRASTCCDSSFGRGSWHCLSPQSGCSYPRIPTTADKHMSNVNIMPDRAGRFRGVSPRHLHELDKVAPGGVNNAPLCVQRKITRTHKTHWRPHICKPSLPS